jgi:hypothetical protein
MGDEGFPSLSLLFQKPCQKTGVQNPMIFQGIFWSADSRGELTGVGKEEKVLRERNPLNSRGQEADQEGEKDLEILCFFRSR